MWQRGRLVGARPSAKKLLQLAKPLNAALPLPFNNNQLFWDKDNNDEDRDDYNEDKDDNGGDDDGRVYDGDGDGNL